MNDIVIKPAPDDWICSSSGDVGTVLEGLFLSGFYGASLGKDPVWSVCWIVSGRGIRTIHNVVCRNMGFLEAVSNSIGAVALDFFKFGALYFQWQGGQSHCERCSRYTESMKGYNKQIKSLKDNYLRTYLDNHLSEIFTRQGRLWRVGQGGIPARRVSRKRIIEEELQKTIQEKIASREKLSKEFHQTEKYYNRTSYARMGAAAVAAIIQNNFFETDYESFKYHLNYQLFIKKYNIPDEENISTSKLIQIVEKRMLELLGSFAEVVGSTFHKTVMPRVDAVPQYDFSIDDVRNLSRAGNISKTPEIKKLYRDYLFFYEKKYRPAFETLLRKDMQVDQGTITPEGEDPLVDLFWIRTYLQHTKTKEGGFPRAVNFGLVDDLILLDTVAKSILGYFSEIKKEEKVRPTTLHYAKEECRSFSEKILRMNDEIRNMQRHYVAE